MKKTRKFLIMFLFLLCSIFTVLGFSGCAKENKIEVIDGVHYLYMSEGRIKYIDSHLSYNSGFEEGYYVVGINVNHQNENIIIHDTINGKEVKGITAFEIYEEKHGSHEYTDFDSDGQIKYGWSIGTYYESVDSDEIYETIKTITFSKNVKLFKTLLALPNLTAINVPEDNPYFQSIDGNLYNKDGTRLIQYAHGKTEKNFSIPDSVASICYGAFRGCSSLISVTIPDSVTSIGSEAFRGCSSLTEIVIPDSVTIIHSWAFTNCDNLTSVTIGNGITSIGEGVFTNCDNLVDLYISDIAIWCNISYGNPFYYADNLYLNNELTTELVIPEGVTSIASRAFMDCTAFSSVTIPNSVTSIGALAFYNCSGLTSVIISDSVTSIDYRAFEDCPIENATIPTLACDDIPQSNLKTIVINSGDSIPNSAFKNCTSLTHITIPNSVTSIGSTAFYGCSSLISITIPDSVTSIGVYAFEDCDSLNELHIESIEAWCNIDFNSSTSNPLYNGANLYLNNQLAVDLIIPDTVSKIKNSTFVGSTFKTVTIPNSVTSIGTYAFRNCDNLTSITIPDSVTSIGDYAFYNCNCLAEVYIENIEAWCNIDFYNSSSNPLYYGANLYLNNQLAVDLIIPDTVSKIKNSTFVGSTFKTVTIPNSVTSIGNYAFRTCDNLTSIIIPDTVTSIGDYAFYSCDNLISITLGNSVTSIGDNAFNSCVKLSNIFIPDTVTSIGEHCFYDCYRLTIYSKFTCAPSNWDSKWNSSNCPVVWGYKEEN